MQSECNNDGIVLVKMSHWPTTLGSHWLVSTLPGPHQRAVGMRRIKGTKNWETKNWDAFREWELWWRVHSKIHCETCLLIFALMSNDGRFPCILQIPGEMPSQGHLTGNISVLKQHYKIVPLFEVSFLSDYFLWHNLETHLGSIYCSHKKCRMT